MKYYISAIKNYFDFETRATRTEYWLFVLFNIIIAVILGALDTILDTASILSTLYLLFVLIPSISIAVRRLHDTGRSGWWILLSIIPLIGHIWLFVLHVLDSEAADNAYGPNPKREN